MAANVEIMVKRLHNVFGIFFCGWHFIGLFLQFSVVGVIIYEFLAPLRGALAPQFVIDVLLASFNGLEAGQIPEPIDRKVSAVLLLDAVSAVCHDHLSSDLIKPT